jgi:hypothetical protein
MLKSSYIYLNTASKTHSPTEAIRVASYIEKSTTEVRSTKT